MKARIAKKIGKRCMLVEHYVPPHLQKREIHKAFIARCAPISKKMDALRDISGIGPSMGWFIYDERTGYPKQASFAEFTWFRMCHKNIIKRTDINEDEFISTVCLGLDHNFSFSGLKQMPVIFETAWCRRCPLPIKHHETYGDFRGLWLIEQERSSTKGEALKHHNDLIILHKQLMEQAVFNG